MYFREFKNFNSVFVKSMNFEENEVRMITGRIKIIKNLNFEFCMLHGFVFVCPNYLVYFLC